MQLYTYDIQKSILFAKFSLNFHKLKIFYGLITLKNGIFFSLKDLIFYNIYYILKSREEKIILEGFL